MEGVPAMILELGKSMGMVGWWRQRIYNTLCFYAKQVAPEKAINK